MRTDADQMQNRIVIRSSRMITLKWVERFIVNDMPSELRMRHHYLVLAGDIQKEGPLVL